MNSPSTRRDRFALASFGLALLTLSAGYGYLARERQLFPYSFVELVRRTLHTLRDPPIYIAAARDEPPAQLDRALAYDGVNLITSVTPDEKLSVKLVDMDGSLIHEWNPDWFEIWPDASHLSESERPKSRPGTHIHGTYLASNGDLLFNFERLGMVRLDRCGEVVWRLPHKTHHAIYPADDGTLWVTADRDHRKRLDWLPSHEPPFVEPLVLQVSQQGQVLREISLLEVLAQNDLLGLLLIREMTPWVPGISGDTLHLNDVEVFPHSMTPGFFQPGDILVSLRNINTVMVLDPDTLEVKFRSTGRFVGQHDPDFIDGNTISVFDNNNSASEPSGVRSRIVELSAPSGQTRVVFSGTRNHHFFTHKMGKHQRLPNGNLLLTETFSGRAFEVTPSGQVVWEFLNRIDERHVAIVEGAKRLPRSAAAPFAGDAASCQDRHAEHSD